MPCEQFEVAFQALSQWLADRAVLPIESSVGGSIHAVYDLLLKCATPGTAAPLLCGGAGTAMRKPAALQAVPMCLHPAVGCYVMF